MPLIGAFAFGLLVGVLGRAIVSEQVTLNADIGLSTVFSGIVALALAILVGHFLRESIDISQRENDRIVDIITATLEQSHAFFEFGNESRQSRVTSDGNLLAPFTNRGRQLNNAVSKLEKVVEVYKGKNHDMFEDLKLVLDEYREFRRVFDNGVTQLDRNNMPEEERRFDAFELALHKLIRSINRS